MPKAFIHIIHTHIMFTSRAFRSASRTSNQRNTNSSEARTMFFLPLPTHASKHIPSTLHQTAGLPTHTNANMADLVWSSDEEESSTISSTTSTYYSCEGDVSSLNRSLHEDFWLHNFNVAHSPRAVYAEHFASSATSIAPLAPT